MTYTAATTDGRITGANATYATARSTSTTYASAAATASVGQDKVTVPSTLYSVHRTVLEFDTSAIPAGATISAVTLYLRVASDQSVSDFTPTVVSLTWTSPLAAGNREANYDAVLVGSNVGNFGSTGAGSWAAGTWKSASLSTSCVTKAGTTQLGVLSNLDIAGTAPAGREFVDFSTADSAGNEPYLDIAYTVGRQPRRAMIGVGW